MDRNYFEGRLSNDMKELGYRGAPGLDSQHKLQVGQATFWKQVNMMSIFLPPASVVEVIKLVCYVSGLYRNFRVDSNFWGVHI